MMGMPMGGVDLKAGLKKGTPSPVGANKGGAIARPGSASVASEDLAAKLAKRAVCLTLTLQYPSYWLRALI
jgi:hypothetical protein